MHARQDNNVRWAGEADHAESSSLLSQVIWDRCDLTLEVLLLTFQVSRLLPPSIQIQYDVCTYHGSNRGPDNCGCLGSSQVPDLLIYKPKAFFGPTCNHARNIREGEGLKLGIVFKDA
jgi:hypothetical protein